MNVVVLVGKVVELPVMRETAGGYQCATMILKVDRPFANSEGIYEQDEIAVTLWKGIAQTTCDVCTVNDVVAIKGRLSCRLHQRDAVTYRNYEVIAERVSFVKKVGER